MSVNAAALRELICVLASELLPKGLRVFDQSRGEWPLLDMVEGEPVASAGHAELVTLLGSAEFSEDLGVELAAFRSKGLPLLCIVCLAGDPAEWPFLEPGWRTSYTIEDFDAIAAAAGYEVALKVFSANGPAAACMLLPPDADASAWWMAPEIASAIRTAAARGERQVEKYRTWLAGGRKSVDWRLQSEQWRVRASIAASMIPPGLVLLDVGCGAMYLEEEAAPRLYIPVDMDARDTRTRTIDLNEKALPAEWIDEADVVALMGVLEYVNDPMTLVKSIADRKKPLLCSYNVHEARSARRDLKRGRWRNDYSTAEIEALFAEVGYSITDSAIFTGKQKIWRLDPVTESGGPALPFGPGREAAPPIVYDPVSERKEVAAERKEAARKARLDLKAERIAEREARARNRRT